MNLLQTTFLLLLSMLTACRSEPESPAEDTEASATSQDFRLEADASPISEEQAIAIAKQAVRLQTTMIQAIRGEGTWYVVFHQEGVGEDLFIPGRHTTVTLSDDGKVLRIVGRHNPDQVDQP
jgi:hypothetical protein